MDYDAPASYIFTIIAFGAALLSVVSGVPALVMYETSTAQENMKILKVSLFVLLCRLV
jgi:hypothetical protein